MRISVVTPSFNQGVFLEAAMRSVLDQAGCDIEYVVMDGGSTDGSVETIERFAPQLVHWESARDAGQYDAVTRGFSHTSGEVMGWLNSDDLYCRWAFSIVAEIFAQHPEVEWLTTTTLK
jgi:glycosyltransferase involved in cell wall biosynthesis